MSGIIPGFLMVPNCQGGFNYHDYSSLNGVMIRDPA